MKTGVSSIKKALFAEFSLVAKALSNPIRLEMLDYLAQMECSVEFLAQKCNQKIGNISQHLKTMSRAGLVRSRREGIFIYYAQTEVAQTLTDALANTAVKSSPAASEIIRSYFDQKDTLSRYDAEQIITAIKNRDIVLIDVRPHDEFDAGHIEGARSIPLKELEAELTNLPKGSEIVAYCRGPYCVLSVEAVAVLERHGFKASRLSEGLPQWRQKGLPIQVA
ncbi:ArsR/SmtB family transcription factor [Turneriella parva]|uniref:Transcriptional regulator, ArsR family n=1 Tax=Turneriella parva (strain ATCC BAA-1111 / DSM 21527 / NCTC 11395 / H) TaxID=869212 RepID=I4B9X2_TURPD|nr:metalloregulator ArsR/SmtB family transcription factor [Turneriella parva]AFM14079.1 transcriptional regulator, ArsR family [Turneriella parva DSM 21527]